MRAISIESQVGGSLEVNWVNPKLFVSEHSSGGFGVVSSRPIKSGEKLVVYGGVPLNLSNIDPVDSELRKYFYQLSRDIWYGPGFTEECIGIGEFINHSCSPNAGFIDAVTLAAIRDIVPGEEVSLDYVQWQSSNLEGSSFECDCRSVSCRRRVNHDDWRRISSSDPGYSFCQPHIQALIDVNSSAAAKEYSRLLFPQYWHAVWDSGHAKSFMASDAVDHSSLSNRVFAARSISKGEVVFVTGGKVVASAGINDVAAEIRGFYKPFRPGFLVGPRDVKDVGSAHLLLPAISGNLFRVQGVFLVAARTINRGDALTLAVNRKDYSEGARYEP